MLKHNKKEGNAKMEYDLRSIGVYTFSFFEKNFKREPATVSWIHLRIPSRGPRFKSLSFFVYSLIETSSIAHRIEFLEMAK